MLSLHVSVSLPLDEFNELELVKLLVKLGCENASLKKLLFELLMLVELRLPVVDFDESEDEDDERDDEQEEKDPLLLNRLDAPELVDDEFRLLAHSFTVCFDLRIKLSGNLNETLRTLPTQWVKTQFVILTSLRLLVFSIIIYSPSAQHSLIVIGPFAVLCALNFCGNFCIIAPIRSFCG